MFLILFYSLILAQGSNVTDNESQNSTVGIETNVGNFTEKPKKGIADKVINKINEKKEKDPGLFDAGIERKNLNNEYWKNYGNQNREKYTNWTAEMNERLKKWEQDRHADLSGQRFKSSFQISIVTPRV